MDGWPAALDAYDEYDAELMARFGPPDEVSYFETPAGATNVAPDPPDALLEIHRPDFMADALCAEPAYAGLAWFPERGESSRPAKDVCARCMAVDECLSYAMAEDIDHGIWGGTSARERKKLRREQSAA